METFTNLKTILFVGGGRNNSEQIGCFIPCFSLILVGPGGWGRPCLAGAVGVTVAEMEARIHRRMDHSTGVG